MVLKPKVSSSVIVFDARFESVANIANIANLVNGDQVSGKLERLCTGAIWSEGPVWMHEDQSLLWSDIPNNRMLRWQAETGMSVWRTSVEFTNGHTREHDGALLHCSHGLRALTRTRFNDRLQVISDEVVIDRFDGKRFNSPNDIVVKSDGSIWFTDPPYGIASDYEGYKSASELNACYVFCFNPRTAELRVVTDYLEEPNGLAFSPDESVLYVSDTSAASCREGSGGGGHHHIVAFDVVAGCNLARPRVFAVIEPGLSDGFRVDKHGFIYTSSGDGVQVFHPDGTRLGHIPVPEKVGNLTFGGAAGNELFICASTSLYRIKLNTTGATTV